MYKPTFAVLTLCVVPFLALGCGRPSTTPSETPAPTAPVVDPTLPALARLPLYQRLASEAGNRPRAAVRAETLPLALRARGIAVPQWKQVLGSTIGARYCMAGQTAAGLALALCEFSDDATAARGLAYSRATFDLVIPRRQLSRKGNTVITVARPDGTATLAAEAQRVTDIFASL